MFAFSASGKGGTQLIFLPEIKIDKIYKTIFFFKKLDIK